VRADTFGYIQRSFPGCVSEVDAQEARRVGEMAVRFSAEAGISGSVAMRRRRGRITTSNIPHAAEHGGEGEPSTCRRNTSRREQHHAGSSSTT
jgi:6-phosphofructokinase